MFADLDFDIFAPLYKSAPVQSAQVICFASLLLCLCSFDPHQDRLQVLPTRVHLCIQMLGLDVAMLPLLLYMCSVGFEFTARCSTYSLEHKR